MISIKNLSKKYKEIVALEIENLQLDKGESIGLVGNNGAGKTTLISLILDLIAPSSGEVNVNGMSVHHKDGWKKNVGAYLDENFLIEFLTPDEYLEFIAQTVGWSKEDLHKYLAPFQSFMNNEITGQRKYIRNLSKGNKKKLGIIASMIGDPDIIILDEPFANLDPSTQFKLKELLQAIPKEKLLIVSSHDLNQVTEVSNRILILEKGKLVKDEIKTEKTLVELHAFFSSSEEE